MKGSALIAWSVAAALLASTVMQAQPVVSNLAAGQRRGGNRAVDISFDLSGGNGPMTVSVLVSNDNGATFAVEPRPESLSGDVGPGITNGTGYSIVWDAMADVPENYWPNTRVRVIAKEDGGTGPASLAIAGTVADGGISPLREQTLTFTFGRPVTDFDASDVVVRGGTKGDFAGSGSVYTLSVAATGGTMTISVPRNSVTPANMGASYTYFHQDTWRLNLPGDVPLELIRVPAGTFVMGSPEAEPSHEADETQHQVTISEDFYLSRTEVTQEQWAAIEPFPAAQTFPGNTSPVHKVSWNDIQTWLASLDSAIAEPGIFSLPTEAQSEYASRAGTTTRFSFGDGFGIDEFCTPETERTDNMWYCGNNLPNGAKPVGQKLANPWGLLDMNGNVWEWCEDRYGAYPAGPLIDPTGPVSGARRVIRGGSWIDYASFCRSAKRFDQAPTSQSEYIGFRVAAIR